jgi:hypothetical protein
VQPAVAVPPMLLAFHETVGRVQTNELTPLLRLQIAAWAAYEGACSGNSGRDELTDGLRLGLGLDGHGANGDAASTHRR